MEAVVPSRRVPVLLAATALFGLAAADASGGGLYVNEFGTAVQSMGGAGRAAWAEDASATLHNPATMTELDDHAFATGFDLAFGRVKFDAADSTPSGGGDGGNQAGILPISSLNYVHKLSDRWRAGFSFFSISGSVLDPSNNWAGRFELTDISLLTLSASPTVALEVNDWLSIGGGPVISYGILNWDLRAQLPNAAERNVRFDDLDDWQVAGRFGLHVHPNERFGLGVYYNSKTDFDFRGNIQVPSGLSANFSLNLPLVQFVDVGAWWKPCDRVTLLGTFAWEDWSEADEATVTLGGRSANATLGFKDTYKVAVGTHVQVHDEWALKTGFTFDSSALQNKDRTAALPIDRQLRAAFGVEHDVSEFTRLGFGFVYINLGPGNIRTANVKGDYQNNELFLFGVNVSFKKLPWSGRATL